MSEEEARSAFQAIRWDEAAGKPVYSASHVCYTFMARRIFKCKACQSQFSVTSGTIFSNRKLPIRDYLLAIAFFVNGAKGYAALQLSRDLDVQYKTAFVLSHKLREAIAMEQNQGDQLTGHVEVDGAYFGGHIRPANHKTDRIDRRLAMHQTGKRRVVVVMRERAGRTSTNVFNSEAQSVAHVARSVHPSATLYADEATHWDALHARFLTKRINHCRDQAEAATAAPCRL